MQVHEPTWSTSATAWELPFIPNIITLGVFAGGLDRDLKVPNDLSLARQGYQSNSSAVGLNVT